MEGYGGGVIRGREAVAAFSDELAELGVKGVGEWGVAYDAGLEEREWSDAFGSVDDLIWHHEVAGFDGLLE